MAAADLKPSVAEFVPVVCLPVAEQAMVEQGETVVEPAEDELEQVQHSIRSRRSS